MHVQKNTEGQYCSSALALFECNGIRRNDIEGSCSVALASNSCSPACRTLLEDFRSRLGCCINAHINGSSSRSQRYSVSVDYHVWNLCNVSLPPADCDNGPTVSRPDNVQKCTNEESHNRYYTQNFCLPQRSQPYINAIVLNSTCNQSHFILAENLVSFCTVNANGIPCGIISSNQPFNNIDDLNSDCATSNVSCTLNCRNKCIFYRLSVRIREKISSHRLHQMRMRCECWIAGLLASIIWYAVT